MRVTLTGPDGVPTAASARSERDLSEGLLAVRARALDQVAEA